MAKKTDVGTAQTAETLTELNARIADAGAAVTTAEARGGGDSSGLTGVGTDDIPA